MGQGVRQLWPESVSAVTATKSADIALGAVRYEDDATYGYREYQYVYNSGASPIYPTYGCIISGVSGYSVTVTATSSYHTCFGLVVQATLTTATYGWVMKRGIATFQAESSALALGDGIVLSTDGLFESVTALSGACQTVASPGVCGFAVSAVASGGSGLGYFHCL